MEVIAAENLETQRGPEEWFTGSVWMDAAPFTAPPGARVLRVLFEPGARTHWHTHPEGQVLYVITGIGRAQKEGEEAAEIGPGAVVYFAPGEKHWHGAGPETFMVRVAVNPATASDGGTDWMEPVTEEQYSDG